MEPSRLFAACILLVALGTAVYQFQDLRYGPPPLAARVKSLRIEQPATFHSKILEPTDNHTKLPSKDGGTCQPHLNVAFLKAHKCGSSLIASILFRFGYEHHLTVALPRNKDWPIIGSFGIIKDKDYEHPPDGKRWNIFAHHAMYNKTRFRQLMAPKTRYVTILREPLPRLESAFQFFHLQNRFPGLMEATPKGDAYVTTYLKRPRYWDRRYKPPRGKADREHFCFRNCMVRDLGLSEKDYDNRSAVQELIQGIEKDFTTVLILEHLPASLVLLKRRMCWTFYDILYTTGRQTRKQKYKVKANITKKMKNTFYKHNSADVMLYKRFSDLLFRQIKEEGTDFLEEVKHFETVNSDVSSFCHSRRRKRQGNMTVPKSRWNGAFSVDRSFCARYDKSRKYWDPRFRAMYKRG